MVLRNPRVLRYAGGLPSSGYSLIELLTVICISAILLSLGSGFIDDSINRYKAGQNISQLQLLLADARAAALFSNTKVSLCPLSSQRVCTNDWNQDLTLFTDSNHNRKLDSHESILQTFPATLNNKTLRHFNNLAIGFDANGFAAHSTGSLSYCYKERGTVGAVFIISRNGRIRHSKTTNAENLPKTANGNDIPCPS